LAVAVAPVGVRGRWVRHALPGADPLARPDPAPDHRWQRGATVDALYLADTEDTAWAEWYRHLAEAGVPPGAAMPRELWSWSVDARLANLSDGLELHRAELRRPRPGRAGWPAYQAVGEGLAAEGWAGLIASSAARPAHRIVCLFRAPDGSVPGAAPLPPPRRVTMPPAPPTGMTT
jgi:hypothetical protein